MEDPGALSGVVPIIPTPFTEKEEIDEAALRNLVEFAIVKGIRAACLPAYASEFYKLSDDEKLQVVKIAVSQAAGRMQIIAQSNHPSLKVALSLAKANIAAGADMISFAIPRVFGLPETSLKEYAGSFLGAIPETQVLIQDFNPSGASISVAFIRELKEKHPNFQYLKLEDSLSASKFEAIRQATDGKIGLMSGWGGLYMLELIPAGITGVMPSLGVGDLLQKVFRLRKDGHGKEAFDLFEKLMPWIFFSLQNMELYHYVEKELLMARGVLNNSVVRKAGYQPDPYTVAYVKELNARILALTTD